MSIMRPVSIAAGANVEVPAYLALVARGFTVNCDRDIWCATKDELRFFGDSPIQLLGVVAMFETRGENWPAADQEIEDFLSKFPG